MALTHAESGLGNRGFSYLKFFSTGLMKFVFGSLPVAGSKMSCSRIAAGSSLRPEAFDFPKKGFILDN